MSDESEKVIGADAGIQAEVSAEVSDPESVAATPSDEVPSVSDEDADAVALVADDPADEVSEDAEGEDADFPGKYGEDVPDVGGAGHNVPALDGHYPELSEDSEAVDEEV